MQIDKSVLNRVYFSFRIDSEVPSLMEFWLLLLIVGTEIYQSSEIRAQTTKICFIEKLINHVYDLLISILKQYAPLYSCLYFMCRMLNGYLRLLPYY